MRSSSRSRILSFPIALHLAANALLWVASAVVLLPGTGAAQTEETVDLVEVAPGVLAALQPARLRFFDSNSVILVNEDDILVVDAQANAKHVAAVIAAVRARSDKPVRTLVNTHWHGDHTQGNSVWRDAIGPDLEIIGHATQPEDIEKRARAQTMQDAEELAAALEKAEDELAQGRGLQGEKLDEDGRIALRARLDRNYDYLESMRSHRWDVPNRTFEDTLVLHKGSRTIELHHFRGHTRGDVVLFLPQEKILISGDLVDDLPYGGHGNPRQWLETLRTLDTFDFDTMIPGHGSVRHGKEHLHRITRLVETIVSQVDQAVADGADLETTQKRVDLSAFHDQLVPDDVAQRNWDRFMPETIRQAWLVARGEWSEVPADTSSP